MSPADIAWYAAPFAAATCVLAYIVWPRKRQPDGDDVWNDARSRHRTIAEIARHQ